MDFKNDPETGRPLRKTIKFGTNCDLSDEKKWKPQIKVNYWELNSQIIFDIRVLISLYTENS